MNAPPPKRRRSPGPVFAGLGLVVALVAGWAWWQLRVRLPQLDGSAAVAGLAAPVQIERDVLGVPTITAGSRTDAARALGFLHAQERFFQMDLLRRSGAGELAELLGEPAVPLDRTRRLHGFRATAGKVLATMPPEGRAVVDAYTAGVNAGLAALGRSPWEYAVLRVTPRPWLAEDSVLTVYAMWFDLQEATGRQELTLQALRQAVGGSAVDFFAPRGTSWDAPLDDSTFPVPVLPALRLKPPAEDRGAPAGPGEEPRRPGSSNMAIAGSHAVYGAALLASDMHLNLNVPHIWYRAVLRWPEAGGTRRLVGVTLPGTPLLAAGSNGSIAWAYTNSWIDTADVVVVEVETTAESFYRTPRGYVEIQERREVINVKGGEPVPFVARWTEWGPIIGAGEKGRLYALRWNAHDPEATNLDPLDLETAATVADAIAIAHRSGMPNQNLVVADRTGAIGWTVTGKIPRRVGYDGRFPVSWAYGDRRWDGWLKPDEVPTQINPPAGILWTANQRTVGGADYAKFGDAGYYGGPRALQIRDDLRQLLATGRSAAPADLLAIQLDDRALFLERWHKFLLEVLDDDALTANRDRVALRDTVKQWNGHASTDSAAFRLVRAWRTKVAERTFAPYFEPARARYAGASYLNVQHEDALWRLTHEQPANLLNPDHASWRDLLLAAVDDTLEEVARDRVTPGHFTWGAYNRLRMRHPLSRAWPAVLGRFLDMPEDPLPGAADMPRVQSPSFGASERFAVSPGHEEEGIFHMPGGQSGHPLSPYYRAGHDAWVKGEPTPLLPGPTVHTLVLNP